MARPTKLTDELQAAIVAEVEVGVRFEDAALVCGIHGNTIYNWIERGEAGEEPFAEFLGAITSARAKAKSSALRNVRAGVLPSKEPSNDWKAEAWFLERTFPNEYGPSAIVHSKVEAELTAALAMLKEKLAPNVYDQVTAALAGETSEARASEPETGARVVVRYSDTVEPDGGDAKPPAEPSAPGTPAR